MKPYQFKVTCSVCGETGVAVGRTAAGEWIEGSHVMHRDPSICAGVLARKKAAQELLEAEARPSAKIKRFARKLVRWFY